jgi:AraC family transcriptional regulator
MELKTGQYFGNVVHTVDIEGLIISKSHYQRNFSLPLHYHKNPYFCYVLEGNYSEHSGNKKLLCSKGDVVFHPQNTEHHNRFDNNSAVCFNMEFTDAWKSRVIESNLRQDDIITTNNSHIQGAVIKIHKEIIEFDALSPLMIEGLMLETIVAFSRFNTQKNTVPFWLKKVTDYLHEEYYANPSLSDIASIAGVSSEHLVREFRKCLKMTIGEYLRKIKVENSCHYLKYTEKDLSEIAFELGFTIILGYFHYCNSKRGTSYYSITKRGFACTRIYKRLLLYQ